MRTTESTEDEVYYDEVEDDNNDDMDNGDNIDVLMLFGFRNVTH